MKKILLALLVLFFGFFVRVPSASAAENWVSATASWQTIDGATSYQIYFKEAGQPGWTHGVVAESGKKWVQINYLKANQTYYYRVSAMVNRKSVWASEKVLYSPNKSAAVKGATSMVNNQNLGYMKSRNQARLNQYNSVLGDSTTGSKVQRSQQLNSVNVGGADVLAAMSNKTVACANTTSGVVTWTAPGKTIARYHVYFGTNQANKAHALRDVPPSKSSAQLNYLNGCQPYFYSVQAVGVDGKTWWVAQGQVTLVK